MRSFRDKRRTSIYSVSWTRKDNNLNVGKAIDKCVKCLKELKKRINSKFIFLLDYQYKISSIRQKGINVLNGVGLNRFILLKNANDKLKPGEQFDFFIVKSPLKE